MVEKKASYASDTTSCGAETLRSAEEETRQAVEVGGGGADEELWAAARDADVEKVRACLQQHADVNWEKRSGDKGGAGKGGGALVYRGWSMTSQALHVAVLYGADETGDHKQEQQEKAVPVVRLLLEHRADVSAMAERVYVDKDTNVKMCRRVQAIHMAAGAGNAKVVELLLEHGAEIDAKALLQPTTEMGVDDPKVLFLPIHDAVLYNHAECVRLLLRKGVDVNVQNIDGNTPLHLAANLGYVSIVELLLGLKGARRAFEDAVDQRTEMSLKAPRQSTRTGGLLDAVRLAMKVPDIPVQFSEEQKALLMRQNKKEKTALELAAKGGRFPVNDIYWFATCLFALLESKDRTQTQELVDVFASVAMACPEVASDLLRFADESGEACVRNVVDPRNLCGVRKALTCDDEGTKEQVLEKFKELSEKSPPAAVVMLDALTSTPKEKHPVDDPLPSFFVPPRGDLYGLYCVYEDEPTWDFDPADGVKGWHKKLAGDAGDGKEGAAEEVIVAPVPATVHVVNLQGFACPGVLSKLTRQTEDCLFTKLAVHALLKFAWDSMRALFILDMVYEGAAIIIISRWIVTTPNTAIFESELLSDFMGRVAWCIVAGQASQEAVILVWTGIRHKCVLSHGDTMNWVQRNLHRICLASMTIGLACASQEEHWPSEDALLSAALGATSFGHWLTMLYKVRAFVMTGTRLLPIMKAILPIGGMLVILGFLMVGFMHVFWAMDRSHADEVNTWQFITFLFIADNFINDESLGELSQGRQYFLMVLGGISLFVFTSCSLNLFIAVLGEVYEQEQERMPVTFLKERACICSFLMLRPEIPMPAKLANIMPGSGRKLPLGMFFACVATVSLVVGCCTLLKINSWPGALTFAFWAVLQQAWMKHDLTKGWESKYIWYCADLNGVEEIFSLGRSQQDQMLPQNRAWKLKRYITEIMSQLKKHDDTIISAQETQKADLKRVEDAQKALCAKLDRALDAFGAQAEAAPPAAPHPEEAPAAPPAPGRKKRGPKGAGAAQHRGQAGRGSAEEPLLAAAAEASAAGG